METNWSSESNWTITSGSILNCLTIQSSLSFTDDDEQSTATSKSTPLLLLPPSPDSPPCEITINFAGKHELRQVYVRSTARVFEIYCAPDVKSSGEYLCTVRCGVAVRDGGVLRCSSGNSIDSLSNRDSGDGSVKGEDDWVEVKVADTSDLDGRNQNNSTHAAQDLFEATAEIDDVDPCVSVTIRLLSLQSKGCVNVDEIYVFADPVDSEIQESRNENSSGSSLMAMFLPTLMQLSKAKTGLGDLNAVRKDKQLVSEDGSEENPCSSDSVIKTQLKGKASMNDPLEVKLKEVKEGSSQPDTHSQVANMESDLAGVPLQAAKVDSNCSAVQSKIAEIKNIHSAVRSQVPIADTNQGGFSGGGVERVLEQLVSRMDRLEQICLGFQEKMVIPMNCIEARLQRVEQQLDTLTKKSQSSASPSCYRISAPDASSTESDDISCDICLDDTAIREIESENNYLHTEEVSYVSPHDLSDSEYAPQILPGLVVTAPEFSDEEDEVDNASGPEMNSPVDKGKQSIDDALSSALANFLSSSISLESPKNTDTLPHKASEILHEDDDNHESNEEIVKNDSFHLTDSNSKTFNHIQVLPSSNISVGGGEKINGDSNDTHTERTVQEVEEYDRFCSTEGDEDEACVKASISADHNSRTGFNDNVEEDQNGKIIGKQCDGLSSNESYISNELLDNQTPSGHNITQEGPSASAAELPEKTFRENIIENVLGFSLASNVVDFEIPLLDVKFISQRSPVIESFLEALLVETPEISSRDPRVEERNDDLQLKANGNLSVGEQCNLISVDDGELEKNPASDDHLALDEAFCTSIASPVNMGVVDNLQGDHKRKRDVGEISPSSLI